MSTNGEELRAWYRQAMARRIDELRGFRPGLAAGEASAQDAARAVGQALRGSGATFGFSELTDVAALVETSPDRALLRRVEGLISHLHHVVAGGDGRALRVEWLERAGGVAREEPAEYASLEAAWSDVSKRSGLDEPRLAEAVADLLALRPADLSHASRSARRLVPEVLMRRGTIVPVQEGPETITVATADPTSLTMELELTRVTGRRPIFVVAPPRALDHALSALLDGGASTTAPARSPKPAPAAPVQHDGASPRVLIVDDDASSRLLARSVLERRGYEVLEAADGVEALELLGTEEPVALVVADLNMPEMDGLELMWEMRAEGASAHVPVIVLTGETDEILESKLIEEGADDYIRKPLDPRLFLARVGATIRRAED